MGEGDQPELTLQTVFRYTCTPLTTFRFLKPKPEVPLLGSTQADAVKLALISNRLFYFLRIFPFLNTIIHSIGQKWPKTQKKP